MAGKNACNGLIVRLFDYAAEHKGAVTSREGVEYTGSSYSDVMAGLALLRREGYMTRGKGRYEMPSPETYRGRDPALLSYIEFLKKSGEKGRRKKVSSGGTVATRTSKKPRAAQSPPVNEAGSEPAKNGYPPREKVLAVIDYMTEGMDGAVYLAKRSELEGDGRISPNTIAFMKSARLLHEVERDRFKLTDDAYRLRDTQSGWDAIVKSASHPAAA